MACDGSAGPKRSPTWDSPRIGWTQSARATRRRERRCPRLCGVDCEALDPGDGPVQLTESLGDQQAACKGLAEDQACGWTLRRNAGSKPEELAAARGHNGPLAHALRPSPILGRSSHFITREFHFIANSRYSGAGRTEKRPGWRSSPESSPAQPARSRRLRRLPKAATRCRLRTIARARAATR